MGAALWLFRGWRANDNAGRTWSTRRKRRRLHGAEDQSTEDEMDFMMAKGDPEAQCLLKFRVDGKENLSSVPLCRSVLCGVSVEDAYGCHYHAYPSESPHDSHGTALCWSLRRSSLKVHALMCLGRVANSCRKDLVLFDDDVGMTLSYTATP